MKGKFKQLILGTVAEMERELTVGWIPEGMIKAKHYSTRTGRPVGRPPREIPPSFKKYYTMWKNGHITATLQFEPQPHQYYSIT